MSPRVWSAVVKVRYRILLPRCLSLCRRRGPGPDSELDNEAVCLGAESSVSGASHRDGLVRPVQELGLSIGPKGASTVGFEPHHLAKHKLDLVACQR